MSCDTAFLAVSLSDELKSTLWEVASAIEMSPDESLGVAGIGFNPYAEEKLHMTFVFCGEALLKLSKVDLIAMHSELHQIVSTSVIDVELSFKCFDLFPPDKRNLIIAQFEAPLVLQRLRASVWKVCLKYGVALRDDSEWMPHITMGKIKATKAQAGRASCRALSAPSFLVGSLRPSGLTLLGSRPKQAWLNWDGELAFAEPEINDSPSSVSSESDNLDAA